ncbi:conserved hypothetical protein [Mycobacterium tuberculosis 02_1987]|nr:conserved hypothetical protein [Mycobacterium tuberculosis 02_1987]
MRRRRPPHVNAPTPCDRGDVRPPGCPASIPGVEVAGGTRARLRVTADGLQALAGRCATLAGELSAAVAPKLDISGILITRYDPRTVNSREVMRWEEKR